MSTGAAIGLSLGGLGLLVGIAGLVYAMTRPKTPAPQAPPPPPPAPTQGSGGGGTDWGAMVTGLAGTAVTMAGMFA